MPLRLFSVVCFIVLSRFKEFFWVVLKVYRDIVFINAVIVYEPIGDALRD